ncbi:hypothetical protein HGM15179_018893 [Zosterops borbonicus]|uniref:Peptidase A2 domain-containing protein n=1 Tax=Zosterops borbonicus TaxID=364589 RepID=A0A8K1DBE0_9PASS|nr:hypothetical protein HGM15179_018893 [Zosterops borbonicus]
MEFDQLGVLKGACWMCGQGGRTNQIMRDRVDNQLAGCQSQEQGPFREKALEKRPNTLQRVHREQIVPSMANGPLGHGLSDLLLGRSSTSKQGIFVLPGITDADYVGNIGIMVQTLRPPIHRPKRTRLAQLIPLKAQVPKQGVMVREDGDFGSTGTPQVMFTVPLLKAKPIKPITFQHPDSGTLMAKETLLDTGSDVTILPSFA